MTRRHATALAACAAAALLALPAAAQQPQGAGSAGDRGDMRPMAMPERMRMPAPDAPGRDGGALTEQRIRDFFAELQREAQAAVEQREPGRIAEFVRRHLGETAALWSATDVYVGGEKVHTGINTVGGEQLSRMLEVASGGMGWTRAVRGYELQADVREIEMLPGGMARVEVRYQEGGTFAPAEETTAQAGAAPQSDGGGGSPQGTQAQGTQAQGTPPGGPGAPGPVRYASTSDCAHLLSTGAGGEVMIGQTICTGETRIGGS
jgi:hypothetical protein